MNPLKCFLVLLFVSGLSACSIFHTGHPAEETFDDPQVIALAKAAKYGDAEKVDQLLEAGVDINHIGEKGLNPLYWLLVMNEDSRKKKKGFRYLLENGANALQIDESGFTPLHISARYIDPDYLKIILEAQPDIDIDFDIPDTSWSTPLLQAVSAMRYDNFKILVEHGADLEKKNQNGDTPLVMADGNGTWRFAYLLLENGADYEAGEGEITDGNPEGKSEIVWSLENWRYHPDVAIKRDGVDYRQKVIDFLRSKGVEVDPWMPEDIVIIKH